MPVIKAVITFGGEGVRFGSQLPKQFHLLSGKKIYLHTLEKLIHSNLFHEIVLVCPEKWKEEVEKESAEYRQLPLVVTTGGATRQESSYRGLIACGTGTDYVVIHDGVRPFVSEAILRSNVEAVLEHQAVDTCISSTDTLVSSSCGRQIDFIPKRSELFRGQTPQSFHYPLILEAHEEARKKGIQVSDDCSLVVAMNKKVFIVKGDEHNIKITSQLDLFIAEQLVNLSLLSLLKKPRVTN